MSNLIFKKIKMMMLSACLIGTASCGTFVGRQGVKEVDYFQGLHSDMKLLGESADNDGSYNSVESMACLLTIICPVFTIISVPIDAVVDVILLPADYMDTLN